MTISETVLIALITACSSLVGAVAGAFAVVRSSNRAATAQVETTVVRELFAARLQAFTSVSQAYAKLLQIPPDQNLLSELPQIISAACLTASPETTGHLLTCQAAAIDKAADHVLKSTFLDALMGMQKDLSVFASPRIEKNYWRKE